MAASMVRVGRTAVEVVTAVRVGRTVVGVVTATSKGEEVKDRVRANNEPINTAATRLAMRRKIRVKPANDKVGFVLSLILASLQTIVQ